MGLPLYGTAAYHFKFSLTAVKRLEQELSDLDKASERTTEEFGKAQESAADQFEEGEIVSCELRRILVVATDEVNTKLAAIDRHRRNLKEEMELRCYG